VLPCGVGPTNTINRAELCAICHAVKHTCQFNRDETIATDSLCSLHMINRGIRRPHTLRHSKHRDLINGIVECVKQRATRGYMTRFIKVKSHTGIEGNEMADAIAKKAVDIFFQYVSAHEVSFGRHPYATMFWLATNSIDDTNENNGGQLAMSERYVHNLNQDLATRAYNTQGLAGTNESIYANLMKQEQLTADKKISSEMWDLAANGTLTYAHITNAMRIRWGGIYTAKIAARMNRPYMGTHGPPSSGQCPLCGGADSATHIMGECPAHKALHIQRHDATGRCILKHMRKGAHGGYYMIADVGSMEKLAPLGIVHKRIPDWMMPGGADAPSRFDIAMLHKRDLDVIDGVTPASQSTFTTVEIGYRSDYDPDLKKLAEKQLQHAPTCAALGKHYKLDYQIWDIGHTGMSPKRLREQAIRLGVSDVDKLLKEIHTIALQHALGG
jgi:ribonuclease HI